MRSQRFARLSDIFKMKSKRRRALLPLSEPIVGHKGSSSRRVDKEKVLIGRLAQSPVVGLLKELSKGAQVTAGCVSSNDHVRVSARVRGVLTRFEPFQMVNVAKGASKDARVENGIDCAGLVHVEYDCEVNVGVTRLVREMHEEPKVLRRVLAPRVQIVNVGDVNLGG